MHSLSERELKKQMLCICNQLNYYARKIIFDGRNGAPDWLIIKPSGEMLWIELKASGKTPEAHQLREHRRLRSYGQQVVVVDSIELLTSVLGNPHETSNQGC